MDQALPPIRLPDALSDGVITLDGHRVADAEAHLAGEDAEMRRRFDADQPSTLDQTRAAMQRWVAARADGGPAIAYALRAPCGSLAGGCEIRLLARDRASVSYWVFPPFRGQGLASRALRLLFEAARDLEDVDIAEAHIDPDNHPSRRVAESAGFAVSGTVADEGPAGSTIERLLYAQVIKRS